MGKALVLSRHDGGASPHKCVFRPNKRFQPECMTLPGRQYTISPEAIVYTEPARIGHPTTYLLFNVVLAHTMRGPPVVA